MQARDTRTVSLDQPLLILWVRCLDSLLYREVSIEESADLNDAEPEERGRH